VVKRLNEMQGVYCPNPGGAFYAMARLPVPDADVFCQWLLESFSFHGETVMLAPASGFYGSAGFGRNEVRLAYVLNLESIQSAMDCLQAALMAYPERIPDKNKAVVTGFLS
jgi:aspartate aminotransferase